MKKIHFSPPKMSIFKTFFSLTQEFQNSNGTIFSPCLAHCAKDEHYSLAMKDLRLPMQLNSSVFRSPHLALRLSKSEMPLLMSELNAISTS